MGKDIKVGSTYRFAFTTSVDGVPTVLTGTPAISVYKDAGTTESTAGVTLTASFDSKTGLNLVEIDTSSDGTFYSAGSDFSVWISAGTVGGSSVVGTVVETFSIEKQPVNWAQVTAPTTTNNLSGTTVGTATALASAERTAIADAFLARNVAGGSSAGRTVTQAVQTLRNKQAIVAGVYTCYGTDDATPLFEANVTTAAGNPMDSWDPTT